MHKETYCFQSECQHNKWRWRRHGVAQELVTFPSEKHPKGHLAVLFTEAAIRLAELATSFVISGSG